MTKPEDELRATLRATFQRHGVVHGDVDECVEDLLGTIKIFNESWREYGREEADGDWRAAIKTLSAHRPTYVMTYPKTVLDRAWDLVRGIRDDEPTNKYEGEHPLDTKERHSDDG